VKTGSGSFTLSDINTYTGGTTVTGGTLSISSDANLGNGGIVALENGTGITFTAGGTYSHSITVAGDPTFTVGTGLTVTQSGQIADGVTPGDVEVKGGGTLVLSNAGNSYSGGTTVSQGSTLSIAAGGALGNVGGGLTLGDAGTGGTLATTASFTTARDVSLGTGGGTIDKSGGVTTELSGDLGGAGDLTKNGLGTLVLSGTSSHTGQTTVNAGTLQGTTTSLRGDILDNTNVTFDQDTVGSSSASISGGGSLTKLGGGTVTLAGAMFYTGGTTISGSAPAAAWPRPAWSS
jgi:fibronectin-binding autotransporter adhesin